MTIAVPLRGIEAVAKLLAVHAVDDCEGAGKLILEYVGEIRAVLGLGPVVEGTSAGTVSAGLPDDAADVRTVWPVNQRERDVLRVLEEAGVGREMLLNDIIERIPNATNLSATSKDAAVRRILAPLVAEGRVSRRQTGERATSPILYGLITAVSRRQGASG